MATGQRLKILFACNSEHGQANAMFAIAHEMLIRGDVDVHVVSFSDLLPRIAQQNDVAKRAAPHAATELHAHWFRSPSMLHKMLQYKEAGGSYEKIVNVILHETGFRGMWNACSTMTDILLCWNGEQHVAIVEDVQRLCAEIEPNLLVVDSILFPGFDAAVGSNTEFAVLSANAMKDVVAPYQKHGEALWKIPISGIGWDFPLRWWQIPLNIIVQLRFLFSLLFSATARDVSKKRKGAGIKGPMPLLQQYKVPHYVAMPEAWDYHLYYPDHIHGSGPFLLPSEPVEVVDPALAMWIKKGPLVLINRGSHLTFSDKTARNMARGIAILRKARPEVRVLWKCRKEADVSDATFAELQEAIDSDMIRITTWLKPDPLAILRTGNVICFVNHGGANSWAESLCTGVPQVVVPGWYDCWDNAVKADYLGVGVWGNRHAGLSLDGEELGKAFLRACEEQPPQQGREAPKTLPNQDSTKSQGDLRVNSRRLAAKADEQGAKTTAEMMLRQAITAQEKRRSRRSTEKEDTTMTSETQVTELS